MFSAIDARNFVPSATAYGQLGGGCLNLNPSQPSDQPQIAAVNDVTLKNLHEALSSLDGLRYKVRGPDSTPTMGAAPSEPSRNLANDAFNLRDCSYEILSRLEELHRVIGPQ